MDSDHSRPGVPPSRLPHRQILLIFTALISGMLMASINQTIVVTAFPTIVRDLGGLDKISWLVTAYLLASTVSILLYGKLSDIYGRRALFLVAVGMITTGSILCGLAQDINQLIVFRFVQGLGAGGTIALAMATIGDILSPRERGRWIGYIGLVFAVTSVVGPLTGGLITDHFGWRWVFLLNVPVGAVALTLTVTILRLPVRTIRRPIDYLGSALMIGGVGCLLLLVSWAGEEFGWTTPQSVALLFVGSLLILLFILQEARSPEPLLPLRIFRTRAVAAGAATMFIVGLSMFGAIAFLPVYLQVVKGASAASSGLRVAPLMLGLVLMAIFTGQFVSWTGRYRVFPIVGSVLITVGLVLLSTIRADSSYALLLVAMISLGAGLGATSQVVMLAIQNSVSHSDLGAATAAGQFFRTMGASLGVAISGAILNNRLNHYLPEYLGSDVAATIDIEQLTTGSGGLEFMPTTVASGATEAVAVSLSYAFLWSVPMAILAFFLTLVIDETPLRETAHISEFEYDQPESAVPQSSLALDHERLRRHVDVPPPVSLSE